MANVETSPMSRDDAETRNELTKKEGSTIKSKALEAWRFTVASSVLAGTTILIFNIITLAVIYGQHGSTKPSIAFFTGSCSTAEGVSLGLHLVINVLSTILEEVDSTHKKHHWLSIGTPSIRNVFFVSKTKAALWLLLGVSSFPLHMIWNSTVFPTKMSCDYFVISITEDFLYGANWTVSGLNTGLIGDWTVEVINEVLHGLQSEALDSKLERPDVNDFIEKYHTELLPNRRHVLLIRDPSIPGHPEVSTSAVNSSVGQIYYAIYPVQPTTFTQRSLYMIGSWYPGGSFYWNLNSRRPELEGPVRYCYSQTAPEKCKVSIVPVFFIIVVGCNIIKIASFAGALYITKTSKEQPLCTTGDAIQSFFKYPDPYTQGRCLAAKHDYEKWPKPKEWITKPATTENLWTGRRYRWGKAVGFRQSMLYLLITTGLVAATGYLFVYDKRSYTRIIDIGVPHSSSRMDFSTIGVLRGFILGNTPQVVVSYVYLALNTIMSNMLAMAEWCTYAIDGPKKGLRVSSPNTAQRSKYFLSMPFKWAIPSTASLILLHWLVSEAVYFANIEVYQLKPGENVKTITLGYLYSSPLAAYLAISIGSLILVALVLTALLRKYPANIPLSGCCSASIAAACHPSREDPDSEVPAPKFDPDLSWQKLRWGVVEKPSEGGDGIGHATFAAEGTTVLMEGKLYA